VILFPEVVEDGHHRVLRLLDLLALHRPADVQHEDNVLRKGRQIFGREKVNEISVLEM
jgi:hypothetical protein